LATLWARQRRGLAVLETDKFTDQLALTDSRSNDIGPGGRLNVRIH
jgi:hypothetical protein